MLSGGSYSFVFYLIQFPPWRVWRSMMLGMIAKKIAAQKREYMVPPLCARVMRKHIGRMR